MDKWTAGIGVTFILAGVTAMGKIPPNFVYVIWATGVALVLLGLSSSLRRTLIWAWPWSLVSLSEAADFCEQHLRSTIIEAAAAQNTDGSHIYYKNILLSQVSLYARRSEKSRLILVAPLPNGRLWWAVGENDITDNPYVVKTAYVDVHVMVKSLWWFVFCKVKRGQ